MQRRKVSFSIDYKDFSWSLLYLGLAVVVPTLILLMLKNNEICLSCSLLDPKALDTKPYNRRKQAGDVGQLDHTQNTGWKSTQQQGENAICSYDKALLPKMSQSLVGCCLLQSTAKPFHHLRKHLAQTSAGSLTSTLHIKRLFPISILAYLNKEGLVFLMGLDGIRLHVSFHTTWWVSQPLTLLRSSVSEAEKNFPKSTLGNVSLFLKEGKAEKEKIYCKEQSCLIKINGLKFL